MNHTRVFFILLLAAFILAPMGFAQEKSEKETRKAEEKPLMIYSPMGDYFSIQYDDNWTLKNGQGFIELRGKKGEAKQVWIRMYAIGLRSVGGKFKDLEHVVNDMIFQIRDEFKGKVGKKEWKKVGVDQKISARTLTGEQPLNKGKIKIDFYAAKHTTADGVIVSFSFAAPPKLYDKYHKEAMKVLSTWQIKPLGTITPPSAFNRQVNPVTQQSFLVPHGWQFKHQKEGSAIQGPDGVLLILRALQHEGKWTAADTKKFIENYNQQLSNFTPPLKIDSQKTIKIDDKPFATLLNVAIDQAAARKARIDLKDKPEFGAINYLIVDPQTNQPHIFSMRPAQMEVVEAYGETIQHLFKSVKTNESKENE